MHHKRHFLFSLFIVFAILLTACGGSGNTSGNGANATPAPSNKASEKQQILIFPIGGVQDVATLDPPKISDVYSGQPEAMLFSNLVTYDDKANIQPELAQSYSQSADGLSWTFHLKPGLKFSDGSPLTSEDVVYSLDRALQPATKSPFAATELGVIKDADKLVAGQIKTIIGDSILAPDPQTVIVKTSLPAAYLLDSLNSIRAAVLQKSFVEKYGTGWVGHLTEGAGSSGPWILQRYEHNKVLTFVPNSNYFGPKPQLKKVVMPLYSAADNTYKEYQVDRVDFSFVPTVNTEAARNLPNGQLHVDPTLSNRFATMNYMVKPFNNIKIRQAFSLALNKDLIASKVWHNTIIPTNHIIPQGAAGYNLDLSGPAGVKSTAGDPALAKKLFQEGLQEEGLTTATLPPISFEVTVAGTQALSDQWAVMQQMWQSALGISVKINTVDFNKLIADINGTIGNKNVMAASLGWQGAPDPRSWTTQMFAPGSGSNYANYGYTPAQKQVIDELVKADSSIGDPKERMKLYAHAEQQLVDDVAWIVLGQKQTFYVVKPCVVNWPHNAYGHYGIPYRPDWANLYISTQTPCANTSQYQ
ncbi:peptide ABC transporter substrate-binding protein [Ktedonosporobacter rubrisoli]|uniref:Peptide ABC transporter substrate-binding protein n=1 Tax=Ktedonosporobacter rubrisoli TaxID=2509675 RepID=A0A4P6JPA4_KTERU|nr:peptide ABC transporter substrate-binding protein [Ktedonosporobacter rubrisoli]QBD77033.1 peptide ABC transporter substrate-binding protein [Ktedonosporobacter rubrisoli]